MNYLQVAAEYLVAGLLALCAFALPLYDTPIDLSAETLVLLGAAAYVVGVAFDKVADVVLGPVEGFARLRVAAFGRAGAVDAEYSAPWYGTDPFPQDVLEAKIREANDGRQHRLDQLRSRLRSMRALAVLSGPAAIGLAHHLGGSSDRLALSVQIGLLVLLVLLARALRVPRTYELDTKSPDLDTAKKKGALTFLWRLLWREVYRDRDEGPRDRKVLGWGPRVCFLLYCLVLCLWLVHPICTTFAWLPILGGLLSILGLWVWFRITITYCRFVKVQIGEFATTVGEGRSDEATAGP